MILTCHSIVTGLSIKICMLSPSRPCLNDDHDTNAAFASQYDAFAALPSDGVKQFVSHKAQHLLCKPAGTMHDDFTAVAELAVSMHWQHLSCTYQLLSHRSVASKHTHLI
jgi:hypothetical protein